MVSISGLMNVGKQVYKYGKIVVKAAPELTFGTSAEKVGSALSKAASSGASLKETAKAGLDAAQKYSKGNFFAKMWKNLTHLIPDIGKKMSQGAKVYERLGKNKFLGRLNGLAKGIGKKLPFIFAALYLVGEVPNIIKATKEKGIWQGIKETAKPVAKLTGAGVGAAIGSAICPGIGSMIGWFAGEWLAGRIIGKSYSEEQADKEQIQQETIAQLQEQGVIPAQASPQQPQNPYTPADTTNPVQPQNPYQPYPGMTNPFGPMSNPFGTQTSYQNDIMTQNLPFRPYTA